MSRIFLTSVMPVKISEAIEKQLRGAIFSEQLKAGDRLPSEMELSKIFNTSRITVREALRSLEKEGFLTRKQGVKGGSYVREADFIPVINSINHMLKLKKLTLDNLTEASLIIEPEIAKMAALRSTRHDLELMEEALNGLRQAVEQGQRNTVMNIKFHRIIGESCKNPALFFVNTSLMDLLQENISKISLDLSKNRHLLDQHIQIFETIKKRNAEKACSAMRNHILFVQKEIMKKSSAMDR